MTPPTDDATAIRSIVRDLDANLMVEAGAGTGKTYALVSRVVALVKAGVRMENIVAITFTEAAAMELAERIRSRMEQPLDPNYRATDSDPLALDGDRRVVWTDEELERLRDGIGELDQALIQTIHGFAGQLLRQHPMDAGLPPGWSQWDDLAAKQDFDERWDEWLEWALGNDGGVDPALQRVLRHLLASGTSLDDILSLAAACSANYYRLQSGEVPSRIDLAEVCRETLGVLEGLAKECVNYTDRLYVQLADATATVRAVSEAASDPVAAAEALANGAKVDFSRNTGSQGNWRIRPADVRAEFRGAGTKFQQAVRAAALYPLLDNLRQRFAVDYVRARKADGVVSFDDLLVWARDLLRRDEDARRYFREQFTHVLIDEFQDTDPLQAEIAFYLAATADAPVDELPWHSLPLAAGRLFIAGDTKQSIYRFRGADPAVVQKAKGSGQLTALTLSENRRSQRPILDWINAVFGSAMGDDTSGLQAEYVPLQPNAGVQQEGVGAQVRMFGEPSEDRADDIRRAAAADVARLAAAGTSEGERRLSVYDKERGCVRPAKLGDFCILIRTRTGLGILERGLEDAGIPYRIEGGSLLFNTQEVQDLLNCLRAIDNPQDAVSVVAALRSPAFACSDVDLLAWVDGGGSWNYLDAAGRDEASPVGAGMSRLYEYHRKRHDAAVSRLISEFVRERRLEELDLAEHRPRETWRRRQFLIEQARNLEIGAGDASSRATPSLYEFIQWAELQQDNSSRIAEIPAPETDDDAVRIMTMHSAKGLEFPIVVLLDVDYAPRSDRAAMLFDAQTGAAAAAMGSSSRNTLIQTPGYEELAETEQRHRDAEEVRLAYVAATRARDHLLVSRHESAVQDGKFPNAVVQTITERFQELPHTVIDPRADLPAIAPAPGASAQPAPAYDAEGWQRERTASVANRSSPQAVTATWIARRAGAGETGSGTYDETVIEDKDAEADEEQPWRSGRGGTAFGTALHAVLQEAVAAVRSDLPVAGDGSLASLYDRLDAEIDRLSGWRADEAGVASSASEIARLAKGAVRHEAMAAALKAKRLWPEIPVAAPLVVARGVVIVEGIIDLLYLDDDGELVILDYKSDTVADDADLQARMERYRWQGASYAAAVEGATGNRVKDVQFLFVRPNRLATIANLSDLIDRLPEHIP